MALIALFLFYLIQFSSARYYWHDEVINLAYLSGYNLEKINEKLADGKKKTRSELHQFQGVNSDKGLTDTLQALALNPGQPTPLYLILLWLWSRILGNSEWVVRLFSTGVWLSFLVIVYKLCTLLFANQRKAVISVLLIAFSPRFLPLAVQVWEFGLYGLLTSLSSYLLLKAINNQLSLKIWLLYGISLTAGLFTQVFFITVAISHLVYWFCSHRSGSKEQQRYFLGGLGLSILLFVPWLLFVVQRPSNIYAWAAARWELSSYLSRWWGTATGIFVRLNLPQAVDYGVMLVIIGLLVGAVLSLLGGANRRVASFLLALIIVPLMVLLLWDVVMGMRYASVGRFFLPTLLGLVLALAYWLSGLMDSGRPVLRGLGYLVFSFVLILEIFSVLPSGTPEAKYKGYGSGLVNGMVIVNQAEKPLVISEKGLDLLSVSHKGKVETHYFLLKTSKQIKSAGRGGTGLCS